MSLGLISDESYSKTPMPVEKATEAPLTPRFLLRDFSIRVTQEPHVIPAIWKRIHHYCSWSAVQCKLSFPESSLRADTKQVCEQLGWWGSVNKTNGHSGALDMSSVNFCLINQSQSSEPAHSAHIEVHPDWVGPEMMHLIADGIWNIQL